MLSSNKDPRTLNSRGCGGCQCIMVSHAVYIEGMASSASTEMALGSFIGHVACGPGAVAHRGIMTDVSYRMAVAIVGPVSVMTGISMAMRRKRPVEVVPGIEAGAPVAVPATEGHIDSGTVLEHTAHGVAAVDGECPAGSRPGERTIKPSAGNVAVVLPGAEHDAEVTVADIPPVAQNIGAVVDIEQIVEVDFIYGLILSVCQSELMGHLVREEESLAAGGIVAHCGGRDGYRHHHCRE